jgi:hypothetical protein
MGVGGDGVGFEEGVEAGLAGWAKGLKALGPNHLQLGGLQPKRAPRRSVPGAQRWRWKAGCYAWLAAVVAVAERCGRARSRQLSSVWPT